MKPQLLHLSVLALLVSAEKIQATVVQSTVFSPAENSVELVQSAELKTDDLLASAVANEVSECEFNRGSCGTTSSDPERPRVLSLVPVPEPNAMYLIGITLAGLSLIPLRNKRD